MKENKWNKVIKNGTKDLYIHFYKEIVEVSSTVQDTRNIKGEIYIIITIKIIIFTF